MKALTTGTTVGPTAILNWVRPYLRMSCVVALGSYLVVMVLSISALFPSLILVVPHLYDAVYPIWLMLPIPVVMFYIGGYVLILYFMLLIIGGLFASIAVMVKNEGADALNAAIEAIKLRHVDTKNAFFLIAELFLGLLFFYFVYFALLDHLHIIPRAPSFGQMPTWELMFSLLNACIWEELVARVLLLGMPLLFIDAALKRQEAIRPLNHVLGGKLELDSFSIALVIFSSLIFAYAHILSWDLYKVPPVVLQGFALGYLFLHKGLYASILLHFSFNYIGIVPTLLERNLLPLPPLAAELAVILFMTISCLWLVTGAYYFVKHAKNTLGYVLTHPLTFYRR